MIVRRSMKIAFLIPLLAAISVIAPANAVQGGKLKTMPHGYYECALPGSADTTAWDVIEAAGFTLGSASSYRSAEGKGTYLLKGNEFTFTRGPKKGERYRRSGDNRLRAVNADGSAGRMLCVRRGDSTY